MTLVAILGVVWLASSPSGPCAPNFALKLGRSAPAQGSVFLLDVESAASVSSVTGTSAGETLHFWKETSNQYRALLGIDVETRPKSYPLVVEVGEQDGRRFVCTVSVVVADGRFTVERLRVNSKYVELSAKDLARTQEENRRLARIYAGASPERYWQSGFRPPLEGVTGSGSFGKRRVLNGQPRSPHNGEDFPARTGTLIQAAGGGRVVLAEELFFSGNTVILDHGLGLFTIYAHLDSIAVRADSAVEAGAVIGRVGATGRVTGPHLHWAARLGRARVNPMDLLALR